MKGLIPHLRPKIQRELCNLGGYLSAFGLCPDDVFLVYFDYEQFKGWKKHHSEYVNPDSTDQNY